MSSADTAVKKSTKSKTAKVSKAPKTVARTAAKAPPPAPGYAQKDYLLELISGIADGNLTCTVDVSRDPSDPLLPVVKRMVESLNVAFGELLVGSALVDKSSSTMNHTARSVRNNANKILLTINSVVSSTEEMRQNMHSVSASTEELSANMQSIASGARQSNENIDSIQVSIKELTTASKDIAENSAKATAISKEAMQNVTAAFALVNELTAAAKQIDMVTATISEISDQTKLLALNATIESARAGEMGKGFAVVAKEVKDLASQTNTATKDIQSKIAIIHEVTRRTADAITTINGVMKSVNEAITSIAAAAEEQSVTTDDIAKNVVDATERIKEMSNNVGEGAVAVQDVSKSILGATNLSNAVARSIAELGAAGQEVQGDAVTSYAQALEVVSHGGDISRQLHLLKMPERVRASAESATVQLCRFSSSYDVLVERMNDDHRRIFDYINTLHLRIKERTDVHALIPQFKELSSFTRAHFAREEEAMAQANYPDLRAQKRAHEKLLGQVGDIIRDLETGADVDFIEVLGIFRDWLINHIMGMDRKYGPVLRDAGIT